MPVFLPITSDQISVKPYITHKSQQYPYTFLSGSNPSQITIDVATVAPARFWNFTSQSELRNPDGIYFRSLYASLEQLFYNTASTAAPATLPTNGFTLPSGSLYVINVAQIAYGEGIQPGTFVLSASAPSTGVLVDDGNGNIMNPTLTGSIVGNIFYTQGVVVLTQVTNSFSSSIVSGQGLYLATGSAVSVSFNATQTIYEHTVICTMEGTDYNFTANPTILAPSSSQGLSVKPADLLLSGSLTPYMTTIGLYTNLGQLVAIGKFPFPVRRALTSAQSVIVKYDQ